MPISREMVQTVRKRVAENPGVLTAQLAVELNATEAEVITALPLDMRLRAKTEDFEAIWNTLASWGNARQVEDSTPHSSTAGLLPGRFITPHDRVGLPAFISQEEVGYIWFVSKPHYGEESHSVQFFNKDGIHLLSIYVGRDESGRLDRHATAAYQAMRDRFGVIPVPRRHCKGCGGCTCGKKKHVH